MVYKKMLEQMKKAVKQNNNLVLDATFHRRDTRKMFIDEMEDKDGILFIEIQADENIIRKRVEKKRKGRIARLILGFTN